MRRFPRHYYQIAFATGLAVLMAGALLLADSARALPPPCYPTCTSGSYAIGYDTVQPTATGLTANLYYYATTEASWGAYACVGGSTYCPASSMLTSAWTNIGSAHIEQTILPVTYDQLRSGRTYQNVYLGAIVGTDLLTARSVDIGSVTTWPGYGFTPTDTNLGCTLVSPGVYSCSRRIDWTTVFPADSRVTYGLNQANWLLSTPTLLVNEFITASATDRFGTNWLVTNSGNIYKSVSGLPWSSINNPDSTIPKRLIRDIDILDKQNGWIAGDLGLLLHSTDGNNWTVSSPPTGFAYNLYSIYTANRGSAWAVGQAQKIIYFNGAGWSVKYPGDNYNDLLGIFSLDNHKVFSVGTSGYIIYSLDGGNNWIRIQPSGADNSTILYSIASVDGETIWVGGSGGKIWRTTDGVNWIQIGPTNTINSILNINPISKSELWFNTAYETCHVLAADQASPISTCTTDLFNLTGEQLKSISYVNGGRINASTIKTSGTWTVSGTSQTDLTSTTSHGVQVQTLTPGQTYYYVVESYDNNVSTGAFGSFTTPLPDMVAPTINFTSPAGPYPVYRRTCPQAINGTASDNVSVTGVTISVNGGTPFTATGTTDWSASIICDALINGLNTIVATATDGTNTATASMQLVYDTTVPIVTIISPNNSTVNTSTVPVNGTVVETYLAGLEIQLNGGTRVPFAMGTVWTTTSPTLTPGVNTITVFARDQAGNEGSASTTVTYNVPTFTITPDEPTSKTGNVGDSFVFPIRLSAVNGYGGNINLSTVGLPAGMTALFTRPTVNLSATTTVDTTSLIISSTNANPGSYTVTISATDGIITKTTSVAITLNPAADFTFSVSPSSRTVVAGNNTSYQLYISGSTTYLYDSDNAPIVFSATNLPTGATATYTPAIGIVGDPSSGGSATGTLTIATTVTGFATITIQATDGTKTHTATVDLNITPAPDLSFTVSPAEQSVTAGGSPTFFNGNVTAVDGFSGLVGISARSADPAITYSILPNNFAALAGTGTNVTINVIVASNVNCPPPGPCRIPIDLTATSGTVTKTTTVNILVSPDTTAPVITNITANPDYDRVTVTWSTNEAANATVVVYTDTADPSGSSIGSQTENVYCAGACHTVIFARSLLPVTHYYYQVSSTDQTIPNANTATRDRDDAGVLLQFTTLDAPDLIPASIVINSPSDGSELVSLATITGTGTDNKIMSHIMLTISPSYDPIRIDCSGGESVCPFTYSWDTTQVNNGAYIISAQAFATTGDPSLVRTVTVNVNNDHTAPELLCLTGQIECGPKATIITPCEELNDCVVQIHWLTDDLSTSEVDYCYEGEVVDGQGCNPAGGSYLHNTRYDDTDPTNSSPNYQDHSVRLTNLSSKKLYHYRITSCNISALCTN